MGDVNLFLVCNVSLFYHLTRVSCEMEELSIEIFQYLCFRFVSGPSDLLNLVLSSKTLYRKALGQMGEENSFDIDQWRALAGILFCAKRHWWRATEIAIRRNFGDVNQITKLGKNVMSIACHRGHLDVCKQLLSHPKFIFQDQGRYLLEAVFSGNIDLLKLLLADDHFDPSDGAALSYACFLQAKKMVEVLLSDERVDPSMNSNKALINACRNGHAEIVGLLLRDPRVDSSAQGNIALHLACRNGHYKVVELLLQHANVISPGIIHDAFVRAMHYECFNVLKVLVHNPKTNHIDHIREAYYTAKFLELTQVALFLLPFCNF